MKIRELREELKRTYPEKPIKPNNQKIQSRREIKEPVIIGITGSKGKSTTAFIVHEYLKRLGKRSILYSSIKVDSPLSYLKREESIENPIYDREMLLNILHESMEYQTEYIVLEVNERAIEKNIIAGIDFDVRAITNIVPKHNEYYYSPEKYIELKRSFLDGNTQGTNIFGLSVGISKEDFFAMKKRSLGKTMTFGSRYVINKEGLNPEDFDFVLEPGEGDLSTLKGLNFKARVKGEVHAIKTSLMMGYNAMNILCAIAILKGIEAFDANTFQDFIENIVIDGRDEKIEYQNRTLLITPHLVPQLEELDRMKENRIIVLTGTSGTGYIGWNKERAIGEQAKEKAGNTPWAYRYIEEYADHIIITENERAADNLDELLEKQRKMLKEGTSYEVVKDRKKAIERAIEVSEEKDIIIISGRGNRRTFCHAINQYKHFKDQEEVKNIIEEVK